MKKRFLAPIGAVLLAAAALILGCPTETKEVLVQAPPSWTEAKGNNLTFWLVHESYPDTQRLTKMIIDAGVGRTFKASDFNTGTFTVDFRTEHWHPLLKDTHGLATQAGVGYGKRIIDDVYPITNIQDAVREMEMRELTNGQTKLAKASVGRFLVLEFFSERVKQNEGFIFDPVGNALDSNSGKVGPGTNPNAGSGSSNGRVTNYQLWQRTPGAESGWNDHSDSFHQNKHIYTVTQNALLKVYTNGVAAKATEYEFKKAATKYNQNEIVEGEIQVIINNFEAGKLDITSAAANGNNFIKYRLMKPLAGSGKRPLVVYLHGSDGRRIRGDAGGEQFWGSTMSNGVEGVYEFLNNHGQLINTSGPAQWGSRKHQEAYGGYYVLAPQGHELAGHVAEDNKAVIDYVVKNYNVDPTRIYVLGHSMGASGTHSLINTYPNFFAAGSPHAGGGANAASAQKVKGTPMWYFGTRGDGAANSCITGYNELKKAGGNVRLTYYPVNGYNDGFPAGATPTVTNYDYPGNYGFKDDPVVVPGGWGWCHSAFEPGNSDLVKTDSEWNVGFTNTDTGDYTGPGNADAYQKFQWGVKHPNDTAGDSFYTWMFKQARTNPNSNAELDQ